MNEIISWQGASIQLKSYYILVLVAFLFVLMKFRKQRFSILIILLFFNGLFAFYGKNLQNGYRITMVILTIYWLYRTNPFHNKIPDTIFLSYSLFTFIFLFTAYINKDYFSIVFSQYSRYFILFALFFILLKYRDNIPFRLWLEKLIYNLLLIQIFLSIAKLILLGPKESIVGSIASQGGATATSLPLLGFMFFWLKKQGKLERQDWLIVLGLATIGFVSLKRAIWFIMPILVAFLMFYVPRRKIPNRVALISILAIPLVFYFGIRLNPTLNREGRIWGSFDPGFAINYARTYSFGEQNRNEKGVGRGGATFLLIQKFVNNDFNKKEWTGYGLRFIYATNYVDFQELNLGINHIGSATGAFQTMVSNGYLGIIALFWFSMSIVLKTKNKRFRYVLVAFMIWEYFFYTGSVLREIPLSFLLIYLIVFSGEKTENKIVKQKNILSYET